MMIRFIFAYHGRPSR